MRGSLVLTALVVATAVCGCGSLFDDGRTTSARQARRGVGESLTIPVAPTESTRTPTTIARDTVPPTTAPPRAVSPSQAADSEPGPLDDTHLVATPVGAGLEVFDGPGAERPVRRMDAVHHVAGVDVDLVLLVVATTPDGQWRQVLLPVRPNGSRGWVRSADVELVEHDWRIRVTLSEFRIRVWQGHEIRLDAPVAVARDNAPTPGGLYYTTVLLRPPDPGGPYGPYAYGLSGFSDSFESFAGGPAQLGLHGTNAPSSIGTRASSGCIRLRNEDISFLAGHLPLGVPVEVVP